jgi:hypothetical protein
VLPATRQGQDQAISGFNVGRHFEYFTLKSKAKSVNFPKTLNFESLNPACMFVPLSKIEKKALETACSSRYSVH